MALAEATSEYLPAAQEDLSKNLEICDLIKSRQVSGKSAMRAIKNRLLHNNPNLTDACVKNTGHGFLRELASREFVDVLTELCKNDGEAVGARCRDLFQQWALLMGTEEGLQYMTAAYEQCKREGVSFPPPPRNITRTIVTTSAPPEWTDSATCTRCNVTFTVLLRKHHCRRCGKTFCQDCSAKEIALPELGLYDEVRVCETCYAEKFNEHTSVRGSQGNIQKSTIVQGNTGDNGSFEDDIEKAIRLSLQEGGGHPPPPATITKVQEDDYDEEAALAAAITASLQDNDYHTASTRSSQQGQSQPSYDTPSSSATFGSTAAANSEYSSLMVISPIERENVQLFAQLICRLDRDDETLNDPQFLQLAKDMINLRDRLRVAQEKSNSSSFFDLPRIIASLDDAILRFEQLTQPLPYLEQQLHRPKSPAGSITKVDTSRPSAPLPQPPPADVVPVLRPMPLRKSEENLLIPDLDDDAHHQPQQTPKSQPNEDPLAELIVDTPLIQL